MISIQEKIMSAVIIIIALLAAFFLGRASATKVELYGPDGRLLAWSQSNCVLVNGDQNGLEVEPIPCPMER